MDRERRMNGEGKKQEGKTGGKNGKEKLDY